MDMFEQSGHAERLKAAIRDCDSVIVGAGAGLSTAAGLTYTAGVWQAGTRMPPTRA